MDFRLMNMKLWASGDQNLQIRSGKPCNAFNVNNQKEESQIFDAKFCLVEKFTTQFGAAAVIRFALSSKSTLLGIQSILLSKIKEEKL